MSAWASGTAQGYAVVFAGAIDALCGEPPARWHPVVWMGRGLARCGAPWVSVTPTTAFVRGTAAWWMVAAATVGAASLTAVAIHAFTRGLPPSWRPLVEGVLLGAALKPLLAWRLLHDEVAGVGSALDVGLEEGRRSLQRLVSRDTRALTATEIRESALESLAENLNDSWVAPLFWYVIGGLPAAALYRFANTADAMWGYRGPFEWAGKWSARADDVVSFVPARLTAALIAVAAPAWPRGLWCEARKTPSPNGGWPMAAMALTLDVRLSKPQVYVLHASGRCADAAECRRGLRLATRAAWLAVTCAILAVWVWWV